MKANELMIGDWCRMKLTFGTQWYTDKVGCVNPENELEYEPIPLTEDILKANGFEDMDGYFKLMASSNVYAIQGEVFDKEYFGISIQIPSGMLVFNRILLYVHELQHALRICGLNDLADNFKIKED